MEAIRMNERTYRMMNTRRTRKYLRELAAWDKKVEKEKSKQKASSEEGVLPSGPVTTSSGQPSI
jgi:hypothetical protein